MRKLYAWTVGLVALALVAGGLLGLGLRSNRLAPGRVSVTGTGFVELVRDRATTEIGVSLLRPNAKSAMTQAQQVYTDVRAAMLAVGVKAKDLTTSGISLYPEYDYWTFEDREPVLLGYRARITVAVEASIEVAAEVFDAAVEAGGDAVTVSGISFDVDAKQQANDNSRKRAIRDARAKAKMYATELGMELGEAVKVVEVSSTMPAPIRPDYDKGEGAVPIDPGIARTTTVVEVTFEIR